MNIVETKAQIREHRLERASREWLVNRIEALEAEREALLAIAEAAEQVAAPSGGWPDMIGLRVALAGLGVTETSDQ